MCSPATCHSCGKTTWAGCGMHADMVMAQGPADARCSCADEPVQEQRSQSAVGW